MKNRRQFFFLLLAVFFLLLIILIVLIKNNLNQNQIITPALSSPRIQQLLENPKTAPLYNDLLPTETSPTEPPSDLSPAPEFSVSEYNLKGNLPQIPQNLKLYTFKTNFSYSETSQIADKLLGKDSQFRKEGKNFIFSSDQGVFIFNSITGSFSLDSIATTLPFKLSEEDPRTIVTLYLQKILGIIDETVTATAYYKKEDFPELTYVEYHRDWEKTNLPILNPVGILNFPADEPLNNLSLTTFNPSDPDDSSIIFASDVPGKARKNDFNTLTVVLTKDGYILSIKSNIRPIQEIKPLSELGLSLLPPEKIIEELKANGTYFNIALPSGQGGINLAKVYPENKLSSEKVTITDITLALLEKPEGIMQKYLQPVYFVRGYGETVTGIRVNVSQTVPALENQGIAFENLFEKGVVLGAKTDQTFFQRIFNFFTNEETSPDQSSTIKLETFIPTTPTPTPTPSPTPIIIPSSTPEPTMTIVPSPTATPTPTPHLIPTNTPILPTPTDSPPTDCNMLEVNGTLAHRGVEFYVEGIGRLVYFPTTDGGPLAFIGSTTETIAARTPFFNNAQNQILSQGAQNLTDFPERIQYDSLSRLNMDTVYGISTADLFNRDYFRVTLEQALKNNTLAEIRSLSKPFTIPISNLISGYSIGSRVEARWWNWKTYHLGSGCYFISISSPTLFFYPQKPQNTSVEFKHNNLSYVDPYFAGILHFKANPSGKLNFEKTARDKIYYEYSQIEFAKPENGWVIKSADLQSFVINKIAPKLRLNYQESSALIKDVQASLIGKKTGQDIFLGIIPQEEIDKKLPLAISPQPENFPRIHLYLEFINKSKPTTQKPVLKPIERNGFTVIELGVFIKPN